VVGARRVGGGTQGPRGVVAAPDRREWPGGRASRRPGAALSLLACVVAAGCGTEPPAPVSADVAAAEIRFTRVTAGPPVWDTASSPSASWIDVDYDGDDDLYVLNGFGQMVEGQPPQPDRLYLNRGDGTFEEAPDHPLVRDTTYSGSAVWADYDNDGDTDVFVADQRGADNRLYRNDGGGSFVRVEDSPVTSDGGRSFSAAWVDVDADGWVDLYVSNGRSGAEGEADFLYRNRGDGSFERVRGPRFLSEPLASGGPTWGDYDGDGDPDLFLPVDAPNDSRLLRNDGDWTFTEVTAEAGLANQPMPAFPRTSVARWVDYDNDLDLDLFVGSPGGFLDLLFRNDGGRFRRVEAGRLGLDGTYVSDAVWTDVDSDGDPDLVVATWGSASVLYRNDGPGGFHPVDAGEFGDVVAFGSSVSAGDADGDGDRDLYLTQWPINPTGGAPNLLYRNEGAEGNWVEIELRGTTSNGSGIGAEIVVEAEIDGRALRQLRQVTARTSWRSAGSTVRHFGLAGAERIDALEVRWPSGGTQRVEGPLEANRRYTVVEGRGLLSDDGA